MPSFLSTLPAPSVPYQQLLCLSSSFNAFPAAPFVLLAELLELLLEVMLLASGLFVAQNLPTLSEFPCCTRY